VSTRFDVTITSPLGFDATVLPVMLRGVPPEIRVVVALAGELDLATCEIAYDACTRDGQVDIVVDLGGITFLDCAGYGALVSARHVLEQRGGSLTLRNQTDRAARLLTLIDAAAADQHGAV
jgi:anti-anti-sigma factor